MPDKVRELQALFAKHDSFLIATPEYNGAVPALVKKHVRLDVTFAREWRLRNHLV